MNSKIVNYFGSAPLHYNLFAVKLYHLTQRHGIGDRGYTLGALFHNCDSIQSHANLVLTKNFSTYPWDISADNYAVSHSSVNGMAMESGDLIFVHNYHLPARVLSGAETTAAHAASDSSIEKIVDSCVELYKQAKQHIRIHYENNCRQIIIPNYFLGNDGLNGLELNLETLIKHDLNGQPVLIAKNRQHSVFEVHAKLLTSIKGSSRTHPIGNSLRASHFIFSYIPDHLHVDCIQATSLTPLLPAIVCSESPYLEAHIRNMNIITKNNMKKIIDLSTDNTLKNKKFMFISGFSIDQATNASTAFSEGLFLPRQAIIKSSKSTIEYIGKEQLTEQLLNSPVHTGHQINIEETLNDLNNTNDTYELYLDE